MGRSRGQYENVRRFSYSTLCKDKLRKNTIFSEEEAQVATSLRLFSLKQTPWPESTSELYRPSDRRVSVKLVPPFAGRGCHVVSVTDP
jgi:hypothetical protein